MAEGSHTGSERQGAGHSDREDGTGRCGRKPLAGCSLERGDTTPKGGGAGAKETKKFGRCGWRRGSASAASLNPAQPTGHG